MIPARKRGRPAKYNSDQERKAADAQRKRDERARKRRQRIKRERRILEAAKRRLPRATGAAAIQLAQKILRAEGLSMSRGLYIKDAPQGMGLPIFGLPSVEIADAKQVHEAIGGRRIGPGNPSLLGVVVHERERLKPSLRCYHAKCPFSVVGILPKDIDKPVGKARFHCYLHAPIR